MNLALQKKNSDLYNAYCSLEKYCKVILKPFKQPSNENSTLESSVSPSDLSIPSAKVTEMLRECEEQNYLTEMEIAQTADTKPGLQGEASPDLQRTTSTSTESTAPAPEHPVRNRVGSEVLFRDCNPWVLLLVIPIAGSAHAYRSSLSLCSTPVYAAHCPAFQAQVLHSRLARFIGAASPASSAEPPAALGAPVSPILHLSKSPSQSISCAQASTPHARSLSKSPARSAKLAKQSKQAQDISDLKDQVAQVLEYLARQQVQPPAPAPALLLAPPPELTCPYRWSPWTFQSQTWLWLRKTRMQSQSWPPGTVAHTLTHTQQKLKG
ncbi:UNVERIFIED_CONTAM: hypothetical protein FKN15_073275 [Acipenser sinensis]